MPRKFQVEQLIEAVKTSTSIAQVLIKIGLIPAGGNYSTTKRFIKQLKLDTSHFTGQAHSKGKKFRPKRNIEDYLSNQFPLGSNKLKKRLLSENLLPRICSNCNLDNWLSKPIPLELDHINGNGSDNSFLNLRLLCPNCHAFTSTYRGKNISKLSSALPD